METGNGRDSDVDRGSPDPRAAWTLALTAAWQATIGLTLVRGWAQAATAVERLVAIGPAPDDSPLERVALRGLLLDLLRGLRLVQAALPGHARGPAAALCSRLETASRLSPELIDAARALIEALGESTQAPDLELAGRVRAYLEAAAPAPLTMATVAAGVQASPSRVRRAFKGRYKTTAGAFYRKLCADKALDAVVEIGALKLAVDEAHCSLRTLRRRVVKAAGVSPRLARAGGRRESPTPPSASAARTGPGSSRAAPRPSRSS